MANPVSPITLQNIHQHDRPIQDEWGIFDPKQAGLEALMRRILSAPIDQDLAHDPKTPKK